MPRQSRRSRPLPAPTVRPPDAFPEGVDRGRVEPAVGARLREICPDAGRVIVRLKQNGFDAYLCGGCVRDMLLGLQPKDFDLVTSATPRQVKRLFRNSRIIGRRFRLVQVLFADKILEVSTFRGRADAPQDGGDVFIHDDNTFGTPEEDALRRDFTINGLFYDISTSRVIDFVGGLRDLERRTLHTIGDPCLRFREDPVRMLRAMKFAGRLGLRLADDVYAAILDSADELTRAAPARLLEEILRFTNLGGACDATRLLFRTGLLARLVPELATTLEAWGARADRTAWDGYWETLRLFDAEVRAGEPVSNARLLVFFLAPILDDEIATGDARNEDNDALASLAARLRMARKDVGRIRQIVLAQARLAESPRAGGRRRKMSPQHLVGRDWFEDAFFFFRLRGAARHAGSEAVAAWGAQLATAHGGTLPPV